MKSDNQLTKKEVDNTFKKLDIKNAKNNNELKKWIDKSIQFSSENKDIWVVADSSTSFINFNPN